MDGQTDGHGETSIPPYNFVAGGIKIQSRHDITEILLKVALNTIHLNSQACLKGHLNITNHCL